MTTNPRGRLPRVSIGMPVYNGRKFVRGALDSLLAQTFTDFELIISDNASTDNTETICREYAKRDPRIRYVRQSKNLGPHANFQFVLDEAVGECFMWAAADDEWLPTFIAECHAVMENDPSVGVVVTKFIVTSHLSALFFRIGLANLECVTDPDREQRVFRFSNIPFTTHKDNLVYGLWRRQALARILSDLKQSPIGKMQLGNSMNEYALSLYKGGFVNKALFKKKYQYLPPGHILGTITGFFARILQFLGLRERGNKNAQNSEEHIETLRLALQLGQFNEPYISRVIAANERHCRFR